MKLASPLLAALEIGLNRALLLDPDTLEKLRSLQGRSIGVEVRGLGLEFFMLPGLDGVQIANELEGEADTFIRGRPFSMLHTAMTKDRSRLFAGDLEIEGDMELGQRVQRIFNQLEFDWEEWLSGQIGDVAAHQLGRFARDAFGWLSQAGDTLARDTAEYLVEEHRDLPSGYEVEGFMREVDILRDDVSRIEQKIQRLLARQA